MAVSYEAMQDFWEYLEYYPEEDEEGFDGIHHGGIKGIREDAPLKAKEAYKKYYELECKSQEQNVKM